MRYVLFCEKCNITYDITESKDRFCKKCQGYMVKKLVGDDFETLHYSSEEEKRKIAEHIVQNYEDDRKEFGDLEIKILDEIDASTNNGRYEIIMLATLFSEYRMREERALDIWENLVSWFRKRELDYQKTFLEEGESTKIGTLFRKCGAPSTFLNKMKTTARNLRRYNGDLNGLLDESSWRRTIQRIMHTCEGVYQKAFWIARVMRQKGAWDVPGRYCCVSDSHNKGLLLRMGFIKSDDDLFHNSEIMWKYFNERFENRWYDLPVFRFARWKGCSKCPRQICNLDKMSVCGT